MKKYKYTIPEKVLKCFSEDITEVLYKENLYKRDVCYFLHQQGVLEEYVINEYLIKYNHIIREDFVEIITTLDIFNTILKQFSEDLESYTTDNKLLIDEVYLVTISMRAYKDFIFSIDQHGNILKITDNCANGINQSIENFLKNKKNFISDFEFNFQKANIYQMFEDVFKWYYYKEDFENSSNSGAGTLTGWLTEDEAKSRANDQKLIKLNRNFRLKNKNKG